MRELLVRFAELVKREGIEALRSNVYKTNLPSMSLHIKLGFRITRENEHGVEFFAPVASLNVLAAGRRLPFAEDEANRQR